MPINMSVEDKAEKRNVPEVGLEFSHTPTRAEVCFQSKSQVYPEISAVLLCRQTMFI